MFIAVYNNCFAELSHIPPMTIAIWCGTSKPTDLSEYFGRFVEELNRLLNEPITALPRKS